EGLAHLGIGLGGKGLVRREHERRPPEARDDVRHGERLPGARNAEQGLVREPIADALDELVDRLGLIAGRRKRLGQTERAVGEGEDHGRRTAKGSMEAFESSTMKRRTTGTPSRRPEAE